MIKSKELHKTAKTSAVTIFKIQIEIKIFY